MAESQAAFEGTISRQQLYIPINVREAYGLGYNDEVKITLHDGDMSVTFRKPLNAGNDVFISKDILEKLDIPVHKTGVKVDVVARPAGTKWLAESPSKVRGVWRKDVHHFEE